MQLGSSLGSEETMYSPHSVEPWVVRIAESRWSSASVLDDYEEMMKGRQKELNSLKEMGAMTVVKRSEAVGKRVIQTGWF